MSFRAFNSSSESESVLRRTRCSMRRSIPAACSATAATSRPNHEDDRSQRQAIVVAKLAKRVEGVGRRGLAGEQEQIDLGHLLPRPIGGLRERSGRDDGAAVPLGEVLDDAAGRCVRIHHKDVHRPAKVDRGRQDRNDQVRAVEVLRRHRVGQRQGGGDPHQDVGEAQRRDQGLLRLVGPDHGVRAGDALESGDRAQRHHGVVVTNAASQCEQRVPRAEAAGEVQAAGSWPTGSGRRATSDRAPRPARSCRAPPRGGSRPPATSRRRPPSPAAATAPPRRPACTSRRCRCAAARGWRPARCS